MNKYYEEFLKALKGGSVERSPSIGGNGGDIEGGASTYGSNYSCKGATQVSSSDCDPLIGYKSFRFLCFFLV